MEKNEPVVKKSWNTDKIGLYLASFGLLFMFWQSWRDIHKDISDLKAEFKERISVVEVKIDYLEEKVK